MIRLKIAAAAMAVAVALAVPAAAHEAGKGHNGGMRVDAGKYHTELVVDGSTNVVVYLSDSDDKPIPAAGFKATAILVIAGKSERIALSPDTGSRLVGKASAAVRAGVKGVVQLTAPDGATAQAKF